VLVLGFPGGAGTREFAATMRSCCGAAASRTCGWSGSALSRPRRAGGKSRVARLSSQRLIQVKGREGLDLRVR